MSEISNTGPAPAWQLWRNPILRRYCRTRLRPRALGAGVLITLLLAGFVFAMSRTVASRSMGRSYVKSANDTVIQQYNPPDQSDVERVPLIPLLVIQAVVLFIIATGQVAGGMTADADEKTMDYVRLSPMTPLAKVLGYLFGLPIREWLMFALTLPFTAWGLWKGNVAAEHWVPIYAEMLTAALLYHLTGLTAGTVMSNRRWAFLVSMGGVFLLYSVVPQLGKMGLVYFDYLTVWPVVTENIHAFMPTTAGAALKTAKNLIGRTPFFDLDLPEVVFTILSQLVLCLTFVVMLWRRWRRVESHLQGKVWATGLCAWIQFVLLGCSLPLISSGKLFLSQRFGSYFRFGGRTFDQGPPALAEATVTITIYGTVTMLAMLLLAIMIAPARETQERGVRRAAKFGKRSLRWYSDEAPAISMVLVMALCGTVGWTIFARQVIGSHWFPGQELPGWTPWLFALVLVTSGLTSTLLYELRGNKGLFLAAIFIAVLPLLVGSVMATASSQLAPAAVWITAASPLVAPANAVAIALPDTLGDAEALHLAGPRAFAFWQGIMAIVTVWLLMVHRKEGRARKLAATLAPEPV